MLVYKKLEVLIVHLCYERSFVARKHAQIMKIAFFHRPILEIYTYTNYLTI